MEMQMSSKQKQYGSVEFAVYHVVPVTRPANDPPSWNLSAFGNLSLFSTLPFFAAPARACCTARGKQAIPHDCPTPLSVRGYLPLITYSIF